MFTQLSKTRVKVLLIVLIFSCFSLWADWEMTEVFLLPDENTVNALEPSAICALGDKVFVANWASGSISILSPVSSSQVLLLPPTFSSYPNPFNLGSYILIDGKCQGQKKPKVKIYNLLGQLVREIEISNSSYWDGCDSKGQKLPAGIYYYTTSSKNSSSRGVIVLR
jgi:hypothetical protein